MAVALIGLFAQWLIDDSPVFLAPDLAGTDCGLAAGGLPCRSLSRFVAAHFADRRTVGFCGDLAVDVGDRVLVGLFYFEPGLSWIQAVAETGCGCQ